MYRRNRSVRSRKYTVAIFQSRTRIRVEGKINTKVVCVCVITLCNDHISVCFETTRNKCTRNSSKLTYNNHITNNPEVREAGSLRKEISQTTKNVVHFEMYFVYMGIS